MTKQTTIVVIGALRVKPLVAKIQFLSVVFSPCKDMIGPSYEMQLNDLRISARVSFKRYYLYTLTDVIVCSDNGNLIKAYSGAYMTRVMKNNKKEKNSMRNMRAV